MPQQSLVLRAVAAAQRAARAAVVAPPKKSELLVAQHARGRAVIARPDRRETRLRCGAGAHRAGSGESAAASGWGGRARVLGLLANLDEHCVKGGEPLGLGARIGRADHERLASGHDLSRK